MNLAGKYRPQTFSDVVGQENTIKILQNQIQTKQIKNGYLFTGGAGTGKTTIARIFAREINRADRLCVECGEPQFDTSGGVSCANGHGGAESKSGTDRGEIIEVDAASNNGVDHVRELRENCKFKPLSGGYKVYVIDECHMLSTGAWNALLKTLEEPPAHAVFLLCTTDPQKIPATILSRVQRFQFKRMTTQQIVDRLEDIIHRENDNPLRPLEVSGYEYDPSALEYIAKLANGGMRDAISILDTCLSYTQDIRLEDVIRIVSANDYDSFIDLTFYKVEKDNEGVLRIIDILHQSGKDLKQFVKGYIEFIIDIEKYQIGCSIEQLSVPSIYEDKINHLGKYGLFEKYFDKLTKLNEWIKYDPNPKAFIEGVFIAL